jgi:hypothetical protein
MSEAAGIADRLQRLEQLVPQCESIRKGAEYGAALAQATSEVRRAAPLPGRLESLEPALRVLKGTKYLPAGDLVPEFEKLETVGRNLEQCVNTDALKDARFWVKDIQEALQRVEVRLCRAWVARVQSKFGPLQRLGTVLAEIPDTKATGQDIQKWATHVLCLANCGVPTADTVRQFNEAQAEIPARLEALGHLGVDATVRSFLLEVANKRATLASVPPSVLEWLRAKNAQARFRIGLI